MRVEQVPADQWATAPLLSPDNVGRYVLTTWNGNWDRMTEAHQIAKLGRTNITLDNGKSLRVLGPDTAMTTGVDHPTSARTRTYQLNERRRAALRLEIGRVNLYGIDDVATLEAAAVLLGVDLTGIPEIPLDS